MILLIGPESWVNPLKRLLTDRTSHSWYDVISTEKELKGVIERVEIVVCQGAYAITREQERAIVYAEHINETRVNSRPAPKRIPLTHYHITDQ